MTTDEPRIRVLVVDDSAFARKVLREALSTSPAIEVVGIARDGLEALERIAELAPDVVTLDLVMPGLDGLGVLRALPARGGPRVVVVSISDAESALGVQALQLGAVDLVNKPTALATDRLYELSAELVRKVVVAGGAKSRKILPAPGPLLRPAGGRGVQMVVIGASTGGPQALTRLVTALPGELSAAVAIALHIPAGYTDALAHRLDQECALSVFEAADGAELRRGSVALARGGMQLRLAREGGRVVTRLEVNPAVAYAPSVDVLFDSAAAVFGPKVLGVVLTGMGDDGLLGARAIAAAGGSLLTESESSCIVYGMPRCVREAGLSAGEAPIEEMAALILQHL
jgi:two-component system chemotaxis response regulator CheB